jgi:hypothetical protein
VRRGAAAPLASLILALINHGVSRAQGTNPLTGVISALVKL